MKPHHDERLKSIWHQTIGAGLTFDAPIGRRTVRRFGDGMAPASWSSRTPQAGVEIGRGGMGVVFREQQSRLQRDVAVKRVRPDRAADPRMLQQFLAEARITGMLDHPNVVPVHELQDDDEGRPILVMKLVEGRTWAELLAEARNDLPHDARQLDRQLEILLDVCNAVAFAHTKDIIHRDLKPENVMVGAFGEVLVMDWGLGIDVSLDRSAPDPIPHVSSVTSPMGSPAYMAPELAWGDGSRISKQSDVYLLGAILYELLTGDPPHAADTLWMSVLSASEATAPDFGPDIPTELAAIARRALMEAPEDRHASVLEFAADLRAYREHRQSLELSRAAGRALDSGDDSTERRYGTLAEAIEGFRQAQILWPENPEAGPRLREARLRQTRAALDADDLELAAEALSAIELADVDSRSLTEELHLARRRARHSRIKARLLTWAVGAVVLSLSAGLFFVDRARKSEAEALRVRERAQREAEVSHAVTAHSAGQLAARSGRWSQAIESYEKALAQGHPDPILVKIGIIEAASGMLDHARVAHLLSEIPADTVGPHRAKLDLLRGEVLVDRFKTPEKGLDLIRAAIDSGDLDPADQAYGEAILAPTIPASLAILEKILEGDPSHRLANELMLGLLAGTGHARRCREFAEKLRVVYPEDPQAILAHAAAIAMGGKVEEANRLIDSLESRVSASEFAHARRLAHTLSFATVVMDSIHGALLMGQDQKQILKGALRLVNEMGAYFEEVQKHEDAMAAEGHALFRITPAHAQYVRSTLRAIGLDKV
ncbi:MAG: protein kinase, partial [Planctomycetes bacterium]|nr:protein kinase [Planctomycetota bacterium]